MKTRHNITWIIGAAAVVLAALGLLYVMGGMGDGKSINLTVGTYGEYLYTYKFDTETLEFTETGRTKAVNPSYAVGIRKAERRETEIYAVSETGEKSGVYSFKSDGEGRRMGLTGEQRQTGADPCFAMLYKDRYMLTADYSGGSISVFPIRDGAVGGICQQLTLSGSGPVKDRQESSHIHQTRQLPAVEGMNDDYILATDLGADVIRLVYVSTISSEAGEGIMLTHFKDIPCPAGSGPRHMEFSKDGKTLYCLGELSGEVLVYGITAEEGMPKFTLKQRIMADEVNAGGSADIHIHPSGKWLYTSHRLDNDGIAIFSIKEDGTLEKIGYEKTARHPRNFMISDDGAYMLVACMNDRMIQVFRISDDGSLTLTPSVLKFGNDRPSCVTAIR